MNNKHAVFFMYAFYIFSALCNQVHAIGNRDETILGFLTTLFGVRNGCEAFQRVSGHKELCQIFMFLQEAVRQNSMLDKCSKDWQYFEKNKDDCSILCFECPFFRRQKMPVESDPFLYLQNYEVDSLTKRRITKYHIKAERCEYNSKEFNYYIFRQYEMIFSCLKELYQESVNDLNNNYITCKINEKWIPGDRSRQHKSIAPLLLSHFASWDIPSLSVYPLPLAEKEGILSLGSREPKEALAHVTDKGDHNFSEDDECQPLVVESNCQNASIHNDSVQVSFSHDSKDKARESKVNERWGGSSDLSAFDLIKMKWEELASCKEKVFEPYEEANTNTPALIQEEEIMNSVLMHH